MGPKAHDYWGGINIALLMRKKRRSSTTSGVQSDSDSDGNE